MRIFSRQTTWGICNPSSTLHRIHTKWESHMGTDVISVPRTDNRDLQAACFVGGVIILCTDAQK